MAYVQQELREHIGRRFPTMDIGGGHRGAALLLSTSSGVANLPCAWDVGSVAATIALR